MEYWFSENHTKNVKLSIKVDKQLYSDESKYQRIDIFYSPEFGRLLSLEGFLMLTEKDEFIYHEMIVHPAMAVHPNPKNILIIGGGDGGALRELGKYDFIENIDIVEIDGMVIESAKKHLPFTACGFDNDKVNIYLQDGLKFIRKKYNCYDLIIVDSTDPFGVGEGLFTKEFYGNCYNALKDDGILINQHESPFYPEDSIAMQKAHKRISEIFDLAKVYQAHIPTYPSGHWLFGFASKGYHPINDLDSKAWKKREIETKYYTTNLHKGAFMLPKYVEELLKKVEKEDHAFED